VSATTMAQRAYAPGKGAIRSAKSIEFEVIARITHRLKRAIQSGDKRQLIEALHENRTLWTTLAADVAAEGNQLPSDLRARLFYLAEFTVEQTRKVLRDEANAVVLLEVNAAILGGLQMEGSGS